MSLSKIKLLCLLFFLLSLSNVYCQKNIKYKIGIGYERLIPIDNLSKYFSSKSLRNTKDIQSGNGIVTEFHYFTKSIFSLYLKTGFIWHNTLRKDSLINSALFSNEIKFNTIPFESGLKMIIINSKKLKLLMGFGASYNIMFRHQFLSFNNQVNNSVLNNFGYSFHFIFNYKNITPLLGYAKKGDYNFIYGSIIIPIYPYLFR